MLTCNFYFCSFRNSARVAQYVNRYMDELLRRPEQQQLTDEELEEKISASIVLFKYVEEKDLFRQVGFIGMFSCIIA